MSLGFDAMKLFPGHQELPRAIPYQRCSIPVSAHELLRSPLSYHQYHRIKALSTDVSISSSDRRRTAEGFSSGVGSEHLPGKIRLKGFYLAQECLRTLSPLAVAPELHARVRLL